MRKRELEHRIKRLERRVEAIDAATIRYVYDTEAMCRIKGPRHSQTKQMQDLYSIQLNYLLQMILDFFNLEIKRQHNPDHELVAKQGD